MHRTGKGLAAGLVATIVLSLLLLMKSAVGMLPELDVIRMLTGMAHNYFGMPPDPIVGWILHFLIGTVLWGILFAALVPSLPGDGNIASGVVFGIAAWLVMMIVVMPMAGAGFFGLRLGGEAPVATFILHVIYGAVLGAVYGWLVNRSPDPVDRRDCA